MNLVVYEKILWKFVCEKKLIKSFHSFKYQIVINADKAEVETIIIVSQPGVYTVHL